MNFHNKESKSDFFSGGERGSVGEGSRGLK